MSQNFILGFLREHHHEDLSEILNNARRFYESSFGILRTIPENLLFKDELLGCPVEKIICLLHIFKIGFHEKGIFWISKLYFSLPLPPDWTIKATSINSKKYVFKNFSSDFHPSISYILFLVHHYRTVEMKNVVFLTKNVMHFARSYVLKRLDNSQKFESLPFKQVKERSDSDFKIVGVSLIKEFLIFEKRFPDLIASRTKLIKFMLFIPQKKLNTNSNHFNALVPESLQKKNYHLVNVMKKPRDFKISKKPNNFLELSENQVDNSNRAFVPKNFYYFERQNFQSHRHMDTKNSEINALSSIKIKNSNESVKESKLSSMQIPSKAERIFKTVRDDPNRDVFQLPDKAYTSKHDKFRAFMNTTNPNMKRSEILKLSDQLQYKQLSIPIKKLWQGLGNVKFTTLNKASTQSLHQTGSKLLIL
jgi:hypothetical protein